MKKMLLLCTGLLLAAGIHAAGPVTSKNIVGYLKVPITQNEVTFTGPTFVPCLTDGSTATLGDIKVNENFVPFDDGVQIYNPSGNLTIQATYISRELLDDSGLYGFEAGWYDWEDTGLEFGALNNVTFPYGNALTVFAANSNVSLIYAGEVMQNAKTNFLVQGGATFTGNCSPVNRKLGDIIANENFIPFDDGVQVYNSTGNLIAQVTYISRELLDGSGLYGLESGWYDWEDTGLEFGVLNNIPLPASSAFTAFTESSGVALIVPSPMN